MHFTGNGEPTERLVVNRMGRWAPAGLLNYLLASAGFGVVLAVSAWGAGITIRVSVSSQGEQANDESFPDSLSTDGRFIVFSSQASNIVSDDTNGCWDVFVHDRLTRTTRRVSVSSDGNQGNADSLFGAITADGRYVAFESPADNLVPNDWNQDGDIFVHDRLTRMTTRVSVSSGGGEANSWSYSAAISADGRYVAFTSMANNLVPGDGNGMEDVFVHDRWTGQTTRVSVNSQGGEANRPCGQWGVAISADGRCVAFDSTARNLIPDKYGWQRDIFVHDRLTRQTTRVSLDANGWDPDGDSHWPALSGDGRYATFATIAHDIPPWTGFQSVFRHDRQTGETLIVNASLEWWANNHSYNGNLSADGRFACFYSAANTIVPGDTNGVSDVFVRELPGPRVTRVSVDSSGREANGPSWHPALSGNARFVAFTSSATNLVEGDTNGVEDAFVHEFRTCAEFGFKPGDANCDGAVNNFDIDPFVLALVDAGRYALEHLTCDALCTADCNGDGLVNNFDIDPFVRLLTP